ncbi:putative Elongin-C [Diplocarpon rosae]|nr:putative Elongin-C [Diplocarpon rosae]
MESSSETQGLSKYVTLISSDKFEFVVLREAACLSGAISKMLDPKSGFKESIDSRCSFDEINSEFPSVGFFLLNACSSLTTRSITSLPDSGIVLEKVAEYFYYNYKNRNKEDVPDMEIPPELCLELLMAADFLDSTSLPLDSIRIN